MASHVVIIDSSLRRANVKCTPNTFLSDVLAEACQKLKLPPEQYSLRSVSPILPLTARSADEFCRHNKKTVDLSRTFRFSGLPSGAQLELVQASRSAAPINVALQLPPSEGNSRLTAKFPSTTSVWQILRAFENGIAVDGPSKNFTQRGSAQTREGTADAGRLFYEMPVVNVLGRELASFVDLQKTLAQLGATSGSALLRLDFKNSGQPLEQAMTDISQYFRTSDEATPGAAEAPDSQVRENLRAANSTPAEGKRAELTSSDPGQIVNEAKSTTAEPTQAPPHPPTTRQPATLEPVDRDVKVFLAPTVSTSPAALQPHDERDYVPTIEQVKQHLARLSSAGRNQRLLSDADLAQREAERRARLAAVQRVKVRIRLPDQTSVETEFGQNDTGNDVYDFIRKLMSNGGEDFSLRYVDSKGANLSLRDGPQKLIAEDGWKGNMLVNFAWGETVPLHVRKQPVLKDETRRQAVPMAVASPAPEKSEQTSGGFFGKSKDKDGDKQKSVEAKLKGFLGLGKRK